MSSIINYVEIVFRVTSNQIEFPVLPSVFGESTLMHLTNQQAWQTKTHASDVRLPAQPSSVTYEHLTALI